jgi:hypothetical protein
MSNTIVNGIVARDVRNTTVSDSWQRRLDSSMSPFEVMRRDSRRVTVFCAQLLQCCYDTSRPPTADEIGEGTQFSECFARCAGAAVASKVMMCEVDVQEDLAARVARSVSTTPL